MDPASVHPSSLRSLIEQAVTTIKKGAYLLKQGRRGRPKLCHFRVTDDESVLLWSYKNKMKQLMVRDVQLRMEHGQSTAHSRKHLQHEKEGQSVSLICNNGKSLDLVCNDKEEANVWIMGLQELIMYGHKRKRMRDSVSTSAPSGLDNMNGHMKVESLSSDVSSSSQGLAHDNGEASGKDENYADKNFGNFLDLHKALNFLWKFFHFFRLLCVKVMGGEKLIAICRFGGEFVKDKDGSLSYSGGDARGIAIYSATKFNDFKSELAERWNYSPETMTIKYFFPGNVKTPITISNDKDLKRMISLYWDIDSLTADVFVIPRDNVINHDMSNMVASTTTISEAVVEDQDDNDPSLRKLVVHGLSCTTTAGQLCSVFSSFGELEFCAVAVDRADVSRGYGKITYKERNSAVEALKDPCKMIAGRITVCQLDIASGQQDFRVNKSAVVPVRESLNTLQRNVYVDNVSPEISTEALYSLFSVYGEIEEGPLRYAKNTVEAKEFAFFIYKTVEGATTAVEEPNKNLGGHVLHCEKVINLLSTYVTPDVGFNVANNAGVPQAEIVESSGEGPAEKSASETTEGFLLL